MPYFCDPEAKKERHAAAMRRWNEKNKEKHKEYTRAYYAKNKERLLREAREKRMILKYLSQEEIDGIVDAVKNDELPSTD